jgi:hypothetical protein
VPKSQREAGEGHRTEDTEDTEGVGGEVVAAANRCDLRHRILLVVVLRPVVGCLFDGIGGLIEGSQAQAGSRVLDELAVSDLDPIGPEA